MIRVLIAEDNPVLLRRYQYMIKDNRDLSVVCCVQSGTEAVAQASCLKPDVVLMDIEMETRTAGLDASRRILSESANTKIIILTVYEDDESVFQAFQIGVSDYVLKSSGTDELCDCIRDAYNHQSPIRPNIAEKIKREFQRARTSEESLKHYLLTVSLLTPTELDILNLLHLGMSRQDICQLRCIEQSTLKTHVNHILKKLKMRSIAEVLRQMDKVHLFEYLNHA